MSDRADFFDGQHRYHGDADGLYSPPPYLFDELNSDYQAFLVNGPIAVNWDIDKGMDGTVKHFIANGTERVCDTARRRVLQGETLANEEKIFSIFEAHTELIKRGKQPVPIQFGHTRTRFNSKRSRCWNVLRLWRSN